jgi:SAM-dependent methyltransferase
LAQGADNQPESEPFDEARYLGHNVDVYIAVQAGQFESGRQHYELFGRREGRPFPARGPGIAQLRAAKMARLRPHLRTDMPCRWEGDKADFLTPELRAATRISDTAAVSQNGYDGPMLDLVARYPDGLVLDCGAGSRPVYFPNVVNYEIVDYPSTDVLGVGEALPFRDGTFDAVISVAVLEHVRDPFACAAEIARVLKPGGRLYCCVPFLQPYHGYPHHYFNATPQGIRRLFEDALTVEDVRVLGSTHPVWALQWMLGVWAQGLPPETRKAFRRMRVSDLLRAPLDQLPLPHCRDLPHEVQLAIASATVLTARKPPAGA